MKHDCLILRDRSEGFGQVAQIIVHLGKLMVHVPFVDVDVGLGESGLAGLRKELRLTFQSVEHLAHYLFHVIQLGGMFGEKLLYAYLELL